MFIRSNLTFFVPSFALLCSIQLKIVNMTNTIIEKFENQCTNYFSTHLPSSSSILIDQTTSEYYLNEYKRCFDEQKHFVDYLTEQIQSLNALKSCEMAIDTLSEHLRVAHEFEIKQNELFEQILRELTTTVRLFFVRLFSIQLFICYRIDRVKKNVDDY